VIAELRDALKKALCDEYETKRDQLIGSLLPHDEYLNHIGYLRGLKQAIDMIDVEYRKFVEN
jgi:hypothetical protein